VNNLEKAVEIPTELADELKKNKAAQAVWNSIPPSHQREHAKWVGEAKESETRQRRAVRTIGALATKS
jgi:uncharacterized protein YdeI (YjbR/CyaY-like superfamily)